MSDYCYAQLDENNICTCVSQLSGEASQTNMIRLNRYDTSVLGKKYNNGVWEDVPQVPVEPHYADTQLIMQAFADQELRDLQAQAERQMLAQQQTDIELKLMGVNNYV